MQASWREAEVAFSLYFSATAASFSCTVLAPASFVCSHSQVDAQAIYGVSVDAFFCPAVAFLSFHFQ
jgi:hypothetical protein